MPRDELSILTLTTTNTLSYVDYASITALHYGCCTTVCGKSHASTCHPHTLTYIYISSSCLPLLSMWRNASVAMTLKWKEPTKNNARKWESEKNRVFIFPGWDGERTKTKRLATYKKTSWRFYHCWCTSLAYSEYAVNRSIPMAKIINNFDWFWSF